MRGGAGEAARRAHRDPGAQLRRTQHRESLALGGASARHLTQAGKECGQGGLAARLGEPRSRLDLALAGRFVRAPPNWMLRARARSGERKQRGREHPAGYRGGYVPASISVSDARW